MEQQEVESRLSIIMALYGALGRNISDDAVAMIVSGTARIPYPWLRKACHDLAGTWDEAQRNPGAPAIFRQACNAAGFRAIYRTYDYQSPTPELVKWWPPEGSTAGPMLREAWGERPERITGILGSQKLLLPGGG